MNRIKRNQSAVIMENWMKKFVVNDDVKSVLFQINKIVKWETVIWLWLNFKSPSNAAVYFYEIKIH